MMKRIRNRGFTILLAALVSSLVLVLGLSISIIVRKSVALSSIGRDSQFAFYMADSGAECALFWDVREGIFDYENPPNQINCDGQTITVFVTEE